MRSIKKLFYTAFLVLFLLYSVISFALFTYGLELIEENFYQKSSIIALQTEAKILSSISKVFTSYDDEHDVMLEKLKISKAYFQTEGMSASLEKLKTVLNQDIDLGDSYDILLINRDFVIDKTTYKSELGVDFKLFPLIQNDMQALFDSKRTHDISQAVGFPHEQIYKKFALMLSYDKTHLIQLMYIDKSSQMLRDSILKLKKEYPSLMDIATIHFDPTIENVNIVKYASYFDNDKEVPFEKSFKK